MEVTPDYLAEFVGITGQTVRNYIRDGMPHERRGARGRIRIDSVKAIQWMLTRKPREKTMDSARKAVFVEQERKLRLENDTTEQGLVHREDVEVIATELAGVLVQMCEALASRLPPVIQPTDDAAVMRQRIQEEVRHIRTITATHVAQLVALGGTGDIRAPIDTSSPAHS